MSVEAVHDPSAIIARITENFRLAREGEAAAAVNSAMLIHLFPEESARLNLRSKYSTLLSQALMSLNPELLVCVAEELLKGEKLAADGHLPPSADTRPRTFPDSARLPKVPSSMDSPLASSNPEASPATKLELLIGPRNPGTSSELVPPTRSDVFASD